jgi:hypothetical protein
MGWAKCVPISLPLSRSPFSFLSASSISAILTSESLSGSVKRREPLLDLMPLPPPLERMFDYVFKQEESNETNRKKILWNR